MAIVVGLDAKIYRNTGTVAVPVWDELEGVKDVTLNLTMQEADVTTRSTGGWMQREPTLADASVDAQMIWDNENTDFTAVTDAFFNRTALELLVMDGDEATTGNQGLRATMKVFDFTRNEALTEALTVDVSFKPGYDIVNTPQWYTVP